MHLNGHYLGICPLMHANLHQRVPPTHRSNGMTIAQQQFEAASVACRSSALALLLKAKSLNDTAVVTNVGLLFTQWQSLGVTAALQLH